MKIIPITLIVFLVILSSSFAYEQLTITYFIDQEDNVEIGWFNDVYSGEKDDVGYDYVVYDTEGNEIDRGKFSVDFYTGTGKREEVMFSIPVNSGNVGEIVMYNLDDEEIYRENIDLILCNHNDVCDELENYHFCASDCDADSQDDYCNNIDNGICDPDCIDSDPDCYCGDGICDKNEKYYDECIEDCGEAEYNNVQEETNETENEKSFPWLWTIIIAAIVLICAVIVMKLNKD